MNSNDSFELFPFVWAAIIIIILARRLGTQERQTLNRQGMTDGRALARTVGDWGRPVVRMARGQTVARVVSGWEIPSQRRPAPTPVPSPRSHPLWDRELDG